MTAELHVLSAGYADARVATRVPPLCWARRVGSSAGLGGVARLQDDNGGLGWSPGGVSSRFLSISAQQDHSRSRSSPCARRARTCRGPSRVWAMASG